MDYKSVLDYVQVCVIWIILYINNLQVNLHLIHFFNPLTMNPDTSNFGSCLDQVDLDWFTLHDAPHS
jgi:hypothetical protein